MDLQVIQTSKKESDIVLEGNIDLSRTDEFRSLLVKALINSDKVTLRTDRVTGFGVPALQLLCSAHRTAVRLNKVLTFGVDSPAIVRQAAHDAGFSRPHGCRFDTQGSCLWCYEHEAIK